ncbi:TPA: hypothetical protein ON570_005002 [Citrobacter werkmanii]|nr:hypothetical protein [Citrobacter werkmanii]
MKLRKALVAASVMAALGLSSAAHAFTEDTAYAGHNGTVKFSGTVTDLTPKWMWEVVNAGTPYDYDINRSLGSSANGKTTFSYTANQPITFLQGYLKDKAPNGGQALQPVVELGLADQNLALVSGTMSAADPTLSVKATGTMPDQSTQVEGLVTFKLAQAGVIAGTEAGVEKIQPAAFLTGIMGGAAPSNGPAVANGTGEYGTALTDAAALLANATDYAASPYAAKNLDKSKVWAANSIGNYDVKAIYAAYSSRISEVKTIWTDSEVPATWTANIGVTVTHQ